MAKLIITGEKSKLEAIQRYVSGIVNRDNCTAELVEEKEAPKKVAKKKMPKTENKENQ